MTYSSINKAAKENNVSTLDIKKAIRDKTGEYA